MATPRTKKTATAPSATATSTEQMERDLFAIIELENYYANANEFTLDEFRDLAVAVLSGSYERDAYISDSIIKSWHRKFIEKAALP